MQGFLVWGAFTVAVAGLANLLTKDFPDDAWTSLRRHRSRDAQPVSTAR